MEKFFERSQILGFLSVSSWCHLSRSSIPVCPFNWKLGLEACFDESLTIMGINFMDNAEHFISHQISGRIPVVSDSDRKLKVKFQSY